MHVFDSYCEGPAAYHKQFHIESVAVSVSLSHTQLHRKRQSLELIVQLQVSEIQTCQILSIFSRHRNAY